MVTKLYILTYIPETYNLNREVGLGKQFIFLTRRGPLRAPLKTYYIYMLKGGGQKPSKPSPNLLESFKLYKVYKVRKVPGPPWP